MFQLAAGADTASGEVLMFPRETATPRPGERDSNRRPLPQSLAIRFVRAADEKVTGVLDPYIDPDCDCRAETVFEGRISGNVIQGTYTVHREGNAPVTGVLKVKRRKG